MVCTDKASLGFFKGEGKQTPFFVYADKEPYFLFIVNALREGFLGAFVASAIKKSRRRTRAAFSSADAPRRRGVSLKKGEAPLFTEKSSCV